jgi:hypothetical protein
VSLLDLDLIFEEWKATLRNKNRGAANVMANFEELFETLNKAGATFDEARDFVPVAAKAHYPTTTIQKSSYKNAKSLPKMAGITEKEFIDQWHEDIANKALSAFYSIFPRPKTDEEKDEDNEPKVYGQMSVKEYRMQRTHAESFPRLDTEELEKRIQMGTYNPMTDIAPLLDSNKDDNGNSK